MESRGDETIPLLVLTPSVYRSEGKSQERQKETRASPGALKKKLDFVGGNWCLDKGTGPEG